MNNNIINPTGIQLAEEHRSILEESSGIALEIIQQRGYRTVTDKKKLKGYGFASVQCRVPGLLVPIHTTDGNPPNLHIFIPDDPRETTNKINSKETVSEELYVYTEIPKGMGVRLDCPPKCREMLKDPKIPLWVTDHPKKSDSLASRGKCAISLLGAWGFKGKNPLGGTVFLADWDYIALDHRPVNIIYDPDVLSNSHVQKALKRLTEHLNRRQAQVNIIHLPPDPTNASFGVDGWLASGHSVEELEHVIEAPQPALEPVAPVITILEEDPLEMARPLSLVDGKGYAASWKKVQIKKIQDKDKDGKLIQLDPPKIITEERLVIIREDGKSFGGTTPLEEIGFDVSLDEQPGRNKTWGGKGINRFLKGIHPNPSDVFERIIQVVDHFIDFNRSLADQRTMCELIACWIIGTFFLDAFNVTGYLWLTGEKGSGKSDLLILVAELSYLGYFISHGGSFASIRDMADYGATLAFDDAEGITTINEKDQDKRSLLLAGNHRGATVTVKVPDPDKKWHTKFINAFCPRAFSAIRVPDPVLISRSITVPLVRSFDDKRINIDPKDYGEWPCDRQSLIDDLWALATCNLSKMPEFEKWVGQNAKISGRNLQPWRCVLAVAKWLEQMGVSDVFQRMHSLAIDYQKERTELELGDMTRLVLQALCQCAVSAIQAKSAIKKKNNGYFETKISEVVDVAKSIIERDEWDFDQEKVSARWVGRVIGKLRFDQVPRPGGEGSRRYKIDLQFLVKLAKSYYVYIPEEMANFLESNSEYLGENGTDGTNGSDGTEAIQINSSTPEVDPIVKPNKPCDTCGSVDYWQRPDGGWVCRVCHP